jgi:heme/copper-type cytochrome/quinol oxidase subunit 2
MGEDGLPEGMDRRTRICIRVIVIGLLNFLAYTVVYLLIGGEAVNGWVREAADGGVTYLLKSWSQSEEEVRKGTFIYSAIHSISIWPTAGAVMLAMLTLAKERIVSAMHSTIVRGRTFITILATILIVIISLATIMFAIKFVDKMKNPDPHVEAATHSVARSWH